MHERTQRAVARLMFVFCCAVPTSMTMMVILVTWTPWYHARALRALEARLSQETGLIIEIDAFERSTPSSVVLKDVRVIQPETHRQVARAYRVNWAVVNDGVTIVLKQPELESAELRSAWQMIHDRFLCRPDRTSVPIRFAANDLTIHSDTGSMTMRDVDAWINPIADGVRAAIECSPADRRGELRRSVSPLKIEMVRDRSTETPTTSWTMETGTTALPCSALADYTNVMKSLGPDAEFFGTMRWHLDKDDWWIDLSGANFTNVQLSQLFEEMPHQFTGTADIHLSRGLVKPGQSVDVVGEFRARDGKVGTSLLASLHRDLGFAVGVNLDDTRPVHYDHVALGFKLFGAQLEVNGICYTERGHQDLSPGVVMCANRVSLVEVSNRKLAAIELARAFASPHSVLVPISNQTTRLMDVLLAPSRPPPGQDYGPAARISGAGDWRGGQTVGQPERQ